MIWALPATSLLVRHFGDRFVIFKDVLGWAQGLRSKGLRVGILSDSVAAQAN